MTETITQKILDLKKQRNAVILAHNYQIGEVQDIADYCGDSLGLARAAADTRADVIVFCGVFFMAETAKILSPDKTVLLPKLDAGCPMADMITGEQLDGLIDKHPDALVVCYVNSPAEVKARSHYCCTSSNAVELVKTLPEDKPIIFVPDKYLGSYVQEQTGRDIILWPGYCPTHAKIDPDEIVKLKQANPGAPVMAHPECNPAVREQADEILSTGQMLKFAARSEAQKFIVITEIGILHTLKKQNPTKEFLGIKGAVCPNMKKITLDTVLLSLENMEHKIELSEPIILRSKGALDRMLDVIPS